MFMDGDPHTGILNEDEEDELRIFGFAHSWPKKILFVFLVVLSGGSIFFATLLKPQIRLGLTKKSCKLSKADYVLLFDKYNDIFVETTTKVSGTVYFEHKKRKYYWDANAQAFKNVCGSTKLTVQEIKASSSGLTQEEVNDKMRHYGANTIEIEQLPVWRLAVEEVSSPFYVYQIFIVIVWLAQNYYQFAVCILLFSAVSVALHVHESKKQVKLLRDKVQSESNVHVLRDGHVNLTSSINLLPGDIIILSPGNAFTMECDAVLLNGRCTVDESMLTGESVPVSKIAFSDIGDESYELERCKRSTLFSGTIVRNVSYNVSNPTKALVIRTGYTTEKGALVRSILFPKAVNFKLKQDYVKCMLIFFLVGIPCMVYTAWVFSKLGAPKFDIFITVVDVATFLCPPLLPAIMTSINAHAQRRLRKKDIFCLNPNFINFAGGLDVICFDKTGTLTEDSIEFSGALPLTAHFNFPDPGSLVTDIPDGSCLSLVMACCHSLTMINGRIEGDSLEQQLFQNIGWELQSDPEEEDVIFTVNSPLDPEKKIAVHRQFHFESRLKRMTTIIKPVDEEEFICTMKGAPEVVIGFCDSQTVPKDWQKILDYHTHAGSRVIAAATRVLSHVKTHKDVQSSPRNLFESDLEFAGFLVFQNKLKEETTPAIMTLRTVDIRTILVTGDNVLTAISVGRGCGMICETNAIIHVDAKVRNLRLDVTLKIEGVSGFDPIPDGFGAKDIGLTNFPLSIDGESFEILRENDPILFEKVVHRAVIFARMTPSQKMHLVKELQRQEHQVGFVGDGANDCSALRCANAGISLSTAEASVASPFTYSRKNIECFPLLIMEGRGTLSATFGAFKYQASYCFTLLSAVMVLFWDGQKPSDKGYVFIDIILNILPPLMFGTTEPSDRLTKQRPQRSLFSFAPLFSIFSFVFIQTGVYLTGRSYLFMQTTWYEPFVFDAAKIHDPEPSHMQLTVLSLNCMTYIIAAVLFAVGPPFRKGIHSNRLYMIVIFFNMFLTIMVTLYPAPQFALDFVNFKDAPDRFKIMLFFVSLVNFLLCMIWEVVFVQNILHEVILKKIRKLRGNIRTHEKIESSILKDGLMVGGPLSNASVSILVEEVDTFRSSKRKKDYARGISTISRQESELTPFKLMPVPESKWQKKKKISVEMSSL